MSLNPITTAQIHHHLAEVQSIFKPGCKVYLVVDGGASETSLVTGDADPKRVIDLIRHFESGALVQSAASGGKDLTTGGAV